MSNSSGTQKSGEPIAWRAVFDSEVKYLGHEKKNDQDSENTEPDLDPNLTALCLSGGGVRSAIFCGGVLEYLGNKNLLQKFDYLSTVSGGGYTGAALSYWSHSDEKTAETGFQKIMTGAKRVFSSSSSEPEEDQNSNQQAEQTEQPNPFEHHGSYIRHLRANISYLMPGGFRDAMVGGYVVLRSIIINVLIWIGLMTGLFYALVDRTAPADTNETQDTANGISCFSDAGFLNLFNSDQWSELTWTSLRPLSKFFFGSCENSFFLLTSFLGLLSLLALALLFPVFSFGTYIKPQSGYLWRKRTEKIAEFLLVATLVLLPLGLLPIAVPNTHFVDEYTNQFGDAFPFGDQAIKFIRNALANLVGDENTASELGVIGTIIGSAISLFGLFRARLGGVFGPFSSATVVFGALLLIGSVIVLAMHLSLTLDPNVIIYMTIGSLALAIICNVNDVSLGRFYRDRLMEAFMPDKNPIKKAGKNGHALAKAGGSNARQADKLRLTHLKSEVGRDDRQVPGLHLINTNVMSWWAPDTRAQRRRGDNFVLSPLFCGSDMTRWKHTENVAKDRLTLATAMAVSGAAVNPQGGFAGQGPTTAWPVAVAMAFLSIRLGYWLRWTSKPNFMKFGNHIHPGLTQLVKRLFSSEVSGRVAEAKTRKPHTYAPGYLELSDGGHFDNLGLYEMIRRECRVMLVCDGGHDPQYSYDAFSVLIRRVSEDFGAKINFDVKFNKDWTLRKGLDATKKSTMMTGPQDLVARKANNEYPSGAEYADKGYFLASVTYEGNPQLEGQDGYRACRNAALDSGPPRKGLIIYLKSTLIRDVDLTTKGYRGSNPLFPSDPTSNQFFSPEQFEAYRDLGQKIAQQMDNEMKLGNLLDELTGHTDENDLSAISAIYDPEGDPKKIMQQFASEKPAPKSA